MRHSAADVIRHMDSNRLFVLFYFHFLLGVNAFLLQSPKFMLQKNFQLRIIFWIVFSFVAVNIYSDKIIVLLLKFN